MNLYKKLILLLAGAALATGTATAATEAEMDKARAIAAKHYLRFANNGSDYLDNIDPSSLADLKSQLREKELDNIKAFENISPAGDYASWDKSQLAEYWGNTFFKDNASKLISDAAANQQAHGRIKSRINNMTVTVVEAAAAEPDPVATPPSDPEGAAALTDPQDVLAAQEAAALADMQNEVQQEETPQEEETAPAVEQENSGTWVYVMILCILVAVVIALVLYAAKTMKNQKVEDESDDKDSRYQPEKSNVVALAENNRLREKFAGTLAAKNDEIRTLGRKIDELERENHELKAEIRHLRNEASRRAVEAAPTAETGQTARTGQTSRTGQTGQTGQTSRAGQAPIPVTGGPVRSERRIFLGRVNSHGLFVRADKNLNPGHSVYVLTTTDGVRGQFIVSEDPITAEQVMMSPEIWLAGGCVAKDITDTYNRDLVITETPGEAVFEDGAWKVVRKARIRYE